MNLRETIEGVRAEFPEGSEPGLEAETVARVVIPILQALGWDEGGAQMGLEYVVTDGWRKQGRIDVALLDARGRPRAFVEAKRPGEGLLGHVAQTLNYSFMSGVDICALTNGFEWWLYLPREGGPPMERRFGVLRVRADDLDSLVDKFRACFSGTAILDRSAHRAAQRSLASIRNQQEVSDMLFELWKKMLAEPDPGLVELVRRRAAKEGSLRPTDRQVVDFLRSPDRAAPGPVLQGRTAQPAKQVKYTPPPTGFRLWGTHHDAVFHKRIFTGVVDALSHRHRDAFVEKVMALPGRLPKFSTDPKDVSEPHRIAGTEWYVGTALNADVAHRLSRELLVHFGHRAEELEIYPREVDSGFSR